MMPTEEEAAAARPRRAIYEAIEGQLGRWGSDWPSELIGQMAALLGQAEIRYLSADMEDDTSVRAVLYTDTMLLVGVGGDDPSTASVHAYPRSGLRQATPVAAEGQAAGFGRASFAEYWTPPWPAMGRLELEYGGPAGRFRLPLHKVMMSTEQRKQFVDFLPSLLADLGT